MSFGVTVRFFPLGWTNSPNVMSVVTAALCRHVMCTLLYVDDLLITSSSFDKTPRACQIIEDTLLATGILLASLKGCFDAPTQPLPDHRVSISPQLGKTLCECQRVDDLLCADRRVRCFSKHPRTDVSSIPTSCVTSREQ